MTGQRIDPLAPARGLITGLAMACPCWLALAATWWSA